MVQKKIFQAGLGDVHVAQFDAGSSSEIGDFGDQRTSAIGVEIGAVAIGGADFPDASQPLEPLKQIRRMHAQPKAQQVPARDGRFQLLRSSQRNDAAVIDNRKAFAERVGFFHIVRGQQNRFPAVIVFADNLPQEQPGLRIQSGTGFVQEKNLWVMHHGARDGESLHHTAGESANHLVGAIGELEALEERFGALGTFVRGKAEIGAVESKNFARGK